MKMYRLRFILPILLRKIGIERYQTDSFFPLDIQVV